MNEGRSLSIRTRSVRTQPQRGAADSLVLALVLPTILLLLAAVADLARRPIVRSHLLAALQDASLQAERLAFENDTATLRLIDDAFPAAQSLCESVAPGGDCTSFSATPGSVHGVLNPSLSAPLLSAAGAAFEAGLASQTSGLLRITRPDQWAACFGLVRLPVDRSSGMMAGPSQPIGGVYCQGDAGFQVQAQASSGLSVGLVAQHLRDAFGAQGTGAGAWPILDGYAGSAGLGWGSPRKPWLPSVWLISTAYFEIDYYFPGFSGSKEVLTHWYVRALSTPAAIQQAGL